MKRVKALLKALWFVPICVGVLVWLTIDATSGQPKDVTVVEVLAEIRKDNVKSTSAEINSDRDEITVTLKNGKKLKAGYPDGYEGELTKTLVAQDLKFKTETKGFLSKYGFLIFWALAMLALFVGPKVFEIVKKKKEKKKNLGKTVVARPQERLDDVLGAPEAVETFRVLKDFLCDPKEFTDKGIRLERGVILFGPPGTGKTTLAKALAGEADVKLFQMSGSDFIQKYAGTSAVAVREFFDSVIEHQEPCIVFIDELDAVAEKRTDNIGANRDSNTTVAQFLLKVEEVLNKNPYAVIIATTNRLDEVDPAVKRAERLGQHIAMPNPDANGREELLRVKSVKLSGLGNVNYTQLARLSSGMSGADLTVIPNKAALLAHTAGDETVETRHYVEALAQHAMGAPQKHRKVSSREQHITAVHEGGHTIVAAKTANGKRPYRVTIVPVGASGGSTWMIGDDDLFLDRERAMDELTILMGGLAAEKRALKGQFTSGPSHDRKAATDLAYRMICEWGMGSISDRIDVKKVSSDPRAQSLLAEVETLLNNAEKAADEILASNNDAFENLVRELLEHKTLSDVQLAEAIRAIEGETVVL